jgi:hypothetical protein
MIDALHVRATGGVALTTIDVCGAERVVISHLALVLELKPEQFREHRAAVHENREGKVRHEETKSVNGFLEHVGDTIEHGKSPCLRCLFFVVANNA